MTPGSLPTPKQLHVPLKTALIKMIGHFWWKWWCKTSKMNLHCSVLNIQKKETFGTFVLHKALMEDEACQTDQYTISPFTQLDKQQPGVLSTLKLHLSPSKMSFLSFKSDNFSLGAWTWATDLESAASSCSDSSVKTFKCPIGTLTYINLYYHYIVI